LTLAKHLCQLEHGAEIAVPREEIADELAKLVSEFALVTPTWEALHHLMCFRKMVLQSSKRGGLKHPHKTAHDVDRRLRCFQTGQQETLWKEATAQGGMAKPKGVHTRHQTRHQTQMANCHLPDGIVVQTGQLVDCSFGCSNKSKQPTSRL